MIAYYDEHAADLASRYESLSPEILHRAWFGLLSRDKGMILDVGAGSGRDAAWLASLGYGVVAVEPSEGMRDVARSYHPDARVRWVDDRLPELAVVCALWSRFDAVLCNAVWMYVAAHDREQAFRKLAQLLKPGGIVIFTLRQGPPPPQPMESAAPEDLLHLSKGFALDLELHHQSDDPLCRDGVTWDTLVFRSREGGESRQ